MPRSTGNLSITSYRKALTAGQRPERLDPLLRDIPALKELGFRRVEDYITFDVVRHSRGKTDFRGYITNARACRRYRIDYAIYPWAHFYPDWIANERGFTPFQNLEDGSTCRQPSGWSPHTRSMVERFYDELGDKLDRYAEAVFVADCAEYGELGYPTGYTKWLRPDENARPAWWCGDPYARNDFRVEQLRKTGSFEELGRRWGTLVQNLEEITYPPVRLLKSNPDPRKLTPQQRRWVLDFVYWYQDAPARRMRTFLEIAREAFEEQPVAIKLGHADESAIMGHSYSSACRILRNVENLGIRSTHAGVSYFHVKRVATPARFYEFERFSTEPPGTLEPERMAERIFTDACVGVTGYFDYPQNPRNAGDAYTDHIKLLDGIPARADVALLFPEADHYVRIDQAYPKGLLACANAVRDVADYDVIDERLIADGALDDYAVLVIVGDPILEPTGWDRLWRRMHEKSGPALIQVVETEPETPAGSFLRVDGVTSALPSNAIAAGRFRRVIGPPDGDALVDAVRKAYTATLIARGLDDREIELLTARDGVWAGLFEHRLLLYNAGDQTRTLAGDRLAPRQILETERER